MNEQLANFTQTSVTKVQTRRNEDLDDLIAETSVISTNLTGIRTTCENTNVLLDKATRAIAWQNSAIGRLGQLVKAHYPTQPSSVNLRPPADLVRQTQDIVVVAVQQEFKRLAGLTASAIIVADSPPDPPSATLQPVQPDETNSLILEKCEHWFSYSIPTPRN